MTLHEAIELVLMEFGNPMTAQEIAKVLNDREYYQKENGDAVSAGQVSARVSNYPNLFNKIGNEIFLHGRNNSSLNNLIYLISDRLRSKTIYNPDLVLAFLLFYFRTSHLQVGLDYFNKYTFEKFEYYKFGYENEVKAKILDAVGSLTKHFDFAESSEELLLTFKRIKESTLFQIVSDLQLFDFSIGSISHEEFGKTFNHFLSSFSGWGRDRGESSTPEKVSKYIASLVRIESDESFCDPFAGTAGLACEILRSHNGRGAVLQDINPVSVILGKMNLILNGIDNAEYFKGSSVDMYSTPLERSRFDYVISHPPFASRYEREDLFDLPGHFLPSGIRGENVHIQLILHLLNSKGKAIILIPDGFLFTNDNYSREIKLMLLNHDWIEAVHSLPAGSFKPYSGIKTSLLILNKNKRIELRDRIVFKEVSEDDLLKTLNSQYEPVMVPFNIFEYPTIDRNSKEIIVEVRDVIEKDLLLNVNRYTNEVVLDSSYQTLESLLNGYSAGVSFNKKHLDSKEGIPYITIKDLADSEGDFILSANQISTFVGKMSLVKSNALVWDGAVLVAKVGSKLKPTIFLAQTPISSAAFSSNIIALYPNDSLVRKEYLVSQLSQPYFNKQLDQIRAGTAQVFLQIKDLLQLRIKVPPLEEQEKELLALYKAKDHSHRVSKIDREQVEEATQETLISAIKHEFSNLQVLLDGGISSLRLFIERKQTEGGSLSWDEKVVDHPEARTIAEVVSDQESVLREMGNLFVDMQNLLNLKRSNLNRERVELKSFFKAQVDQMSSQLDGVSVYYELSEKQKKNRYVTMLDKSLFSKLIKNFLVNSIKHGFEGEVVDERMIVFDFAISEDELWMEIVMMNNGRKFIDGLTFEDFIGFGSKSGTSRGAGIGGYLMNRVIQLHDGTFQLKDFPDGTVLYTSSTLSLIGTEPELILSKAFIPGIAFKIRLPYKD